MRLYQIDDMLEELIQKIELIASNNEGEYPEYLDNLLDNLIIEKEKKILDVARWIKDMEAEYLAIKLEKSKLETKQSSINNKIERVKSWLSQYIGKGNKYNDSNTQISWRKSEVVVCPDDPEELPKNMVKITVTADKAAVKKTIKAGNNVKGCYIQEKQNLQIK